MVSMAAERILLIDDDTDDQLFFMEVVEELNPQIICDVADNGLVGLQLLEKGNLPQIIFLDLNMPYMNGFDFLQHFQKEPSWKHIPVVIFTTSSQQRDIDRSIALGARAFLTKPNSVQELKASLQSILSYDFLHANQSIRIF
jgi:CheY-like chemotaxis protein